MPGALADPPDEPAYAHFAPYYDAVYERLVDYEGDVRFLEDVFREHSGRDVSRVLDLGCGTGNHAIGLARHGLTVDGVDITPGLLQMAYAKARDAGLTEKASFYAGDMTEELPDGPFDAAICMFGTFGYITDDARTDRFLDLLQKRVPKGGLFVVEFWNAIGVRPQRTWDRGELADGRGVLRLSESTYDLSTGVVTLAWEVVVTRGQKVEDRFHEQHHLRARTPAEMRLLLERHGFEVVAFCVGAREGKRMEPPKHDEFRVMALARRS